MPSKNPLVIRDISFVSSPFASACLASIPVTDVCWLCHQVPRAGGLGGRVRGHFRQRAVIDQQHLVDMKFGDCCPPPAPNFALPCG